MSNIARLVMPRRRAVIARWLLALWAMLVLPALAHPQHDMAAAKLTTATIAESAHCAEHVGAAHIKTIPADTAQNCLCLQACASAIATLAAIPTLPQSQSKSAPPFALPNKFFPASPASTPYRPPITAHIA